MTRKSVEGRTSKVKGSGTRLRLRIRNIRRSTFDLRLGLALLCAAAAGCASVKPWQREDLARPTMVADQSPGEERFQQHARGAREGADGGNGTATGGCGCN